MGGVDKFEAAPSAGQDTILEVRVELIDSEPKIWRQLELRGSLALDQVHQVLQAAFGWVDAHLHRVTTGDRFAPLRPVDGQFPEVHLRPWQCAGITPDSRNLRLQNGAIRWCPGTSRA